MSLLILSLKGGLKSLKKGILKFYIFYSDYGFFLKDY